MEMKNELLDFDHKYGFMAKVKTTLEIPDPFYRKLKVAAVQQGKTVRQFVNEAIAEKLRKGSVSPGQPAWKQAFGGLEHLHEETKLIEQIIQKEFSRIDPEDWR
ncbi:MAG TPA: hypothetical protein VFC46_11105 [Humisphaera sp.]|nr:hypothetical protein [Humisphaera sp.]